MLSEWPAIAAIAALAGFGVSFATFWMTFGTRIGTAEKTASMASTEATEAKAELAVMREEHAKFREHVARDYASRDVLKEFEDRLAKAINDLAVRFDRFMERVLREG